jgi:hypothetical protein
VPADLACLGRPVVGTGEYRSLKIDVPPDPDRPCAPHWEIALVGYVWFGFDPGYSAVPEHPPAGTEALRRVPGYLKGMDVCIMPFLFNEITRNGSR